MFDKVNNMNLLREATWFAERSQCFQEDLLNCGMVRAFETGETLYHHGDPVNGLYAVLDGGVLLAVPADDGQDLVFHRQGVGFWFGDLAMFANSFRLMSVVTTCETTVLFFPSARINSLVQKHPDYIRDFYALTHYNMRTALRVIANLLVTGAEKRVALRLLHLDEGTSKHDGWIIVSQEELAEMVAVSRPTLHRSLHRLEDLDLIEIGYGRILIKDRAALFANCQT